MATSLTCAVGASPEWFHLIFPAVQSKRGEERKTEQTKLVFTD